MNNLEFVQKLKNVTKHKTLYIMGCFGAPMNAKNKQRYCTNHSYNQKSARTKMIQAASADTFGFDCVGLIKGILWGWKANQIATYGGAVYASNNVPDIGADSMITKCSDVSTKFDNIEIGEAVWMKGHIGVYIGDGLVIECTPSWENCVQITACNRTIKGYKRRNWTKHGKLPYLEYVSDQPNKDAASEKPDVLYQVYAGGKWLGVIKNYNTKDSNGYAGIIGKEISGIRVKLSNGKTVTVRSHISGKNRTDWLAPVTKWNNSSNGYSGWKGKPTDCIAMKAEGCTLKYRVHVKDGGWLGWISKSDIDDYDNGLAGSYGKPIDAVQIYSV